MLTYDTFLFPAAFTLKSRYNVLTQLKQSVKPLLIE